MSKQVDTPVEVTLPNEVQAWIEGVCVQFFLSPGEYIRKVVIEHYVSTRTPNPLKSVEAPPPELKTAAASTTTKRKNRSGFKGVYAYGKRWAAVAVVNLNGRKVQQRLGVFNSPEEAARAYDTMCVVAAGDPAAAVNFPDPQVAAAQQANKELIEKLAANQPLTHEEMAHFEENAKYLPKTYVPTRPSVQLYAAEQAASIDDTPELQDTFTLDPVTGIPVGRKLRFKEEPSMPDAAPRETAPLIDIFGFGTTLTDSPPTDDVE